MTSEASATEPEGNEDGGHGAEPEGLAWGEDEEPSHHLSVFTCASPLTRRVPALEQWQPVNLI